MQIVMDKNGKKMRPMAPRTQGFASIYLNFSRTCTAHLCLNGVTTKRHRFGKADSVDVWADAAS
jgi:hypothetical protein